MQEFNVDYKAEWDQLNLLSSTRN